MSDLELQRRFFAEEVEAICNLQTRALVEALATVPRERFLPPGPWVVRSETDYFVGTPRRTPDADPRRVYHNLSIAIEPDRQLFNGAPSLLALCIDRLGIRPGARVLHVGCGLGYYSALMAHCVGPAGHVVAVEIDEALAAAARRNLTTMEHVDVRAGDGRADGQGWFEVILVNAGVTHPDESWLKALAPGGRLILPLTATMPAMGSLGKGPLLLLTKRDADFDAQLLTVVSIYSAIGIRDEALNARLGRALLRGQRPSFTRLRRDIHDETPTCWFHGPHFCLCQ
jgi:protein-L-isoaspartate(D-aspartate) O-methyltransferase